MERARELRHELRRANRNVFVKLDELDRIVQIWADACLQLRERDIKMMQRLVALQDKLLSPGLQAAE